MRALGADGLDLLALDCRDAVAWQARLVRDRRRAREIEPAEVERATRLLLERAVAGGAEAVALTGSTACGRRTSASDLDIHVVGARPSLDGIEIDVDVYATTSAVLFERLRAGDDYVQWTLRFGCVLFDAGPFRAAAVELVASEIWPSPERKLAQAGRLLDLARIVVESGDRDAAVEQARGAMTTLARWLLLADGAFPRSRAELPAQLRAIGADDVAAILEDCIDGNPSLDELAAGLALGRRLAAGVRGALVRHG